jgi:HAD superfamily hydrolase (TIGR01509 family)
MMMSGAPTRPGSRLAAVLWDMDGTLVDTEPYWIECEYELVESFGGTWSLDHAHAIVGFDLLDSARYIAEHGGVPLAPREIVERLLDGVIERVERRVPWRPGARELLSSLRDDRVPCALVTMSWSRFVDPVLAGLPDGSFDVVITGDRVTMGKPHPEPYVLATRRLGVEPADCVAIEDSPTGVVSALAAGCHVVGVPNVRDIEAQDGVVLVESLESIDTAFLQDLITGPIDPGLAPVAEPEPPIEKARSRRRRLAIAGLVTALCLGGAGIAIALQGDDPAPPPPPAVPLDAWAPYWTLDVTVAELPDRIDSIRELSPFWFQATDATTVAADPHAPAGLTEQFMDIARDSDVAIVPSVVDAMPAGGMAAVLADPTTRTQHVDTLVRFVVEGDYAGVDLDYEQFAFADGRETWAATRPNWVAFVTELAGRLHAEGRTLTVSVPPVYHGGRNDESGFWVYDHGTIATVVDRIRLMAYDYSTTEAGPIAPLDHVRRSVEGTAGVVEDDSKLVLGLPVYGYNWPIATAGVCPAGAEGRTAVTPRSLAELLERRDATPVRDDELGEWSFTYELDVSDGTTSCTQTRQVNYVDGDGALERLRIARQERLGGVALWALGYESESAWMFIDGEIRRPDAAGAPPDSIPGSTG